jgi:hypothetical protein
VLAMSDLTKDAIEVILKHLTDRLALAALISTLLRSASAYESRVVYGQAGNGPLMAVRGTEAVRKSHGR